MSIVKCRLQFTGKTSTGDIYRFLLDGKQYTVQREEAIKLVRETPSSLRDCTVRNGKIVKKPGAGHPEIIDAPGNLATRAKRNSDKSQRIVKITTEWPKDARNSIVYTDSFFDDKVAVNQEFLRKYSRVINEIDSATPVFQKYKTNIDTPFGTAPITELSTGCKTVLNALFILQYKPGENWVINSDESGDNAFCVLCRAAVNSELTLYTTVMHNFYKLCRAGIQFELNGSIINDPSELLDLVGEAGAFK